MVKYNLKYMNQSVQNDEFVKAIEQDYCDNLDPKVYEFNHATILPAIKDTIHNKALPWGIGGVVDQYDNYIEESGVPGAFGGKYPYNKEDVEIYDFPVIHINIIPKHWGHFLIDVVCRLWILVENIDEYQVSYCYNGWEDGIDGNYLEFFKLLGVDENKLIAVKKPMKFNKVIIPQETMSYGGNYKKMYRKTIDYLIDRIDLTMDEVYDKIYFTRRNFGPAKRNEVGEREIENCFERNGYKVLSPERLTLLEQIKYIRNAKSIASISGTIPHNIVFASEGVEIIILNRTSIVNPPQIRINQIIGVNCTCIDVYNKIIARHPVDYGNGPLWVEITEHLIQFMKERKWDIPHDCRSVIKINNLLKFQCLKIWKILKSNSIIYTFTKIAYNFFLKR